MKPTTESYLCAQDPPQILSGPRGGRSVCLRVWPRAATIYGDDDGTHIRASEHVGISPAEEGWTDAAWMSSLSPSISCPDTQAIIPTSSGSGGSCAWRIWGDFCAHRQRLSRVQLDIRNHGTLAASWIRSITCKFNSTHRKHSSWGPP
jgi:hypothetical protein